VRDRLAAEGLLRADRGDAPADHVFLSSGDITWFADLGRRLLGPELTDATTWRPGGVMLPPRPHPVTPAH
jgi:hypothetical protein